MKWEGEKGKDRERERKGRRKEWGRKEEGRGKEGGPPGVCIYQRFVASGHTVHHPTLYIYILPI